MANLDVKNLYPVHLQDQAHEVTEEKLKITGRQVQADDITKLLKYIDQNNYYGFDNKIY